MLPPKVRQFFEALDGEFVRRGQVPGSTLEAALSDARTRGNDAEVAALAVQLGMRLLATATVSRSLSGQPGGESFPSSDDVLEPAVKLLSLSVTAAHRVGDARGAAFAQARLADAFLQSGQFRLARAQFVEVAEQCALPSDAWLFFDATQKVGDCNIELENDASALVWYQRAMNAAREIDDPFEIHVQHCKIASALNNLKQYDEALQHLGEARDLLVRIGADSAFQTKIVVHRNMFSLAALPALIKSVDKQMAHAREGLGYELLRDLPQHIGERAVAVLTGRTDPAATPWVVERELLSATRSATEVLELLLGLAPRPLHNRHASDDRSAVLQHIGALARAYFGVVVPDPTDIRLAARQLTYIDRSRRAALLAAEAAEASAGAGPDFGPGSKHIVYLRSFVVGAHLPACEVTTWGRVDLEELLACLLDRSPVIALGNPDLERFGPGRVRTTDENWHHVLRGLALNAQMLIVIPAVTQGTCWELEWVSTNKLLHKTCFIMPASSGQEALWWESNWTELKRWAVRLGLNVPAYSAAGGVFRLGEFGDVERINYSELYDSGDLHMTLLGGLLFRLNPSYDFLYAIQKLMSSNDLRESKARQRGSSGREVGGLFPGTPHVDQPGILTHLEESERYEMSNWSFDSARVPHSAGLLLMYEGPFRLLWVQDCLNMYDTLEQIASGQSCDFTRALFHFHVLPTIQHTQSEQLLSRTLDIEDVVRVRVKQVVTYRYCQIDNADDRAHAVAAVSEGALKVGAPQWRSNISLAPS